MRVKLKEIARELGVPAATVSLAVNDRPGINEATKKRVLDFIRKKEEERLQEYQALTQKTGGAAMMINYMKDGIIMNRSGRKQPVMEEIERTVRQAGYDFHYRIIQERKKGLEELIGECKSLEVKGIYMMAAEMRRGDIYPFLNLHVPIVAGDNLFYEEGVDSFLIDNREGISRAVDYLVDKGHSHIIYLAENIEIFNFGERREAFVQEMAAK